MVILPFEEAFYAKNGMKVHYVGHPLLDAVTHEVRESEEVRDFRTDNRLDGREIIALLPGSRKQEITALLPQMLTLVPLFPQYQFVVSTVSWQPKSLYDQLMKDAEGCIVTGVHLIGVKRTAGIQRIAEWVDIKRTADST